MIFINCRPRKENLPSELRKYSCLNCRAAVQEIIKGDAAGIIKGCEHFPLKDAPYLPLRAEKKPEKVGNIRI